MIGKFKLHIFFATIFCIEILCLPILAIADDALPPSEWGIAARVISIYDGDTIKVIAYPWPAHSIETNVRLEAIDTPEIRGDCETEVRLAQAARDRLTSLAGNYIYLRNIQNGRYANRIVAEVYSADGEDITSILLEEDHGRPWAGNRESWCD